MELPVRVIIFCPTLEFKNKQGRLLAISEQGFYEIRMEFAERDHTVLLPIASTALIFADANYATEPIPEIER
ncbi:MAG TPA: hypothetical protein VGS00_07910 [Thermoanaerobaculia bacterium]|nr:hypothetical protein [Thermoanaerobaculia bacterium]